MCITVFDILLEGCEEHYWNLTGQTVNTDTLLQSGGCMVQMLFW